MEWEQLNKELVSRRILITKPELNGKTLSQLKIRNNFGASVTRVNRSGVDLVAARNYSYKWEIVLPLWGVS